MYKKLFSAWPVLIGGCILGARLCTEYWLWTYCMDSPVSPDEKVIQPSFSKSSDPLPRVRFVLSDVSSGTLLEFLRVCIETFGNALALFLRSTLGRLWLSPLFVCLWGSEISVFFLCFPLECCLECFAFVDLTTGSQFYFVDPGMTSGMRFLSVGGPTRFHVLLSWSALPSSFIARCHCSQSSPCLAS